MRVLGTLHFVLAAIVFASGVTTTVAAWGHDATSIRPQGADGVPNRTESDIWKQGAFSLKGIDGGTHSLTEWKGKVIMLNFWATWCAPCQAEIADFITLQDEYQAMGLQIIGLGLDDEKKLRNVQRTLEINYPILITDPQRGSKLMEKWGNSIGIVPYTVVIDRQGQVRYIHRGPLHRDTFDEKILPLLSKG